jgi:allophanate hydrolase subunit 1
MTKVRLHYELTHTLDDAMLQRISDAPKLFGLTRVQLEPSATGLMVEYDASRLTPADVEASLRKAGLPVRRKM